MDYVNDLSISSPTNDEHPMLLTSIATSESFSHQFAVGGKLQDLDKSIQSFRSALDLCPAEHPLRSTLLDRLATSLLARFNQEGNAGDLDDSIETHREALALRPNGHPDRALSLNNLASSLAKRSDQATLIEDLDDVIKLHQAVSKFRHRSSAISTNFVWSFLDCFERSTGSKDLSEAIELHRSALALHPEGHPDRPMTLNKLGHALAKRFEDGGKEDDLNESVELLRSALALLPMEHPDHYASLIHLATSLLVRFEQGGTAENINHQDVSVSYLIRFQQTRNSDDLDESISLFRRAIAFRGGGNLEHTEALLGLASSLQARFRKDGSGEDFEEAIQLLSRAATRTLSGSLIRLEAAQRWVALARLRDHHTTSDAYKTTISILQHSLTVRPTLSLRHDFLKKTGTNHKLPLDAASYALEKGDLGQAIELLEQGRSLIWSHMRGLRAPLDRLLGENRTLADRFKDVSSRLETLATDRLINPKTNGGVPQTADKCEASRIPDEIAVAVRQLSEEQTKIVDEIRRVSGFEDFLRSPSFETLKEAASEGPVIVINHSSFRCDAIIVLSRTDNPCVCVPLDRNWYEDALGLCNELVVARKIFGEQSEEYDETLRRVMKVLWDSVVSKVVEKLRDLGIAEGSRIWWCPTSYLSSLPFHAAGPYKDPQGREKYLLDDYISSYTPTLMSLIVARLGPCSKEQRLLFIGDSRVSAKREFATIINRKKVNKCLISGKATPSAVTGELKDAEWVHFACHARMSPSSNPFESSFALPRGPLTLLDIAQARLPNAELAFLSACHTAEQSPSFALDEALHLAAAIQFCGFRSVISTMWALLDKDGPVLADAVYTHVMYDIERGEIGFKRAAAAVREAAIYLRSRAGLAYDLEDIKPWRWVNLVHFGA